MLNCLWHRLLGSFEFLFGFVKQTMQQIYVKNIHLPAIYLVSGNGIQTHDLP